MGSLWSRLRARRDDAGFSLVETVVALTIAGFAFSTLSIALISGVHASTLAQQNQQAGDLLAQTVERARALDYAAVTLRPTDLDAGETGRSPSLSTCLCYNPTDDSTSGTGVEPLETPDAAGGIFPHVATVPQNGLSFTVRQYVTVPADATGAAYKRFSVVVTWSSLGKSHERHYSTVLAPTKRGLPLPDYKFTAVGGGLSQCRNPGSYVVYGFNLRNNGARDAWNLTATGDGSWSFYADTNGNGAYDAASDLSMSAAGAASTGLLEPTTQATFFAVTHLPEEYWVAPPYTWTTSFRATSAAQPTYSSVLVATTGVSNDACGGLTPTPTPTATPTTTEPPAPVQPAVCPDATGTADTAAPNGTMVRYYLHNPSYPGSTNASLDMPVLRDGGAPPTGANLFAYSQDYSASAGRWLTRGTGGGVLPDEVASWTYQMPASSTLRGSGSVKFWVTENTGSPFVAPAFQITLQRLNSDGTVSSTLATTTYTPSSSWSSCSGMRAVSLPLGSWSGSSNVIPGNDKLRLSIRLTNSTSVHLGYGTSLFPAEMQLPYRVGLG